MLRTIFLMTLALSTLSASAFAQSRCTALKYTFTGKAALLTAKCYAKAAKKGVPVDPECLGKVQEFLTKKWPKAEGKGDCLSVDDQSTLQADVDGCVDTVIADLGTPLAATCGNDVQEPGEECDGTDNPCLGGLGICQSDCTCSVCSCTNEPSASCVNCLPTCSNDFCGGGTTPEECLAGCADFCCSTTEAACIVAAGLSVGSCATGGQEFGACACSLNSGVSECGCTCDCIP